VWVTLDDTERYAKFTELLVRLMFEVYIVLTPEIKISSVEIVHVASLLSVQI